MLREQDRESFMVYLQDCYKVDEAFNELIEERDAETEEDFLDIELTLSEKFGKTQEIIHEALLLVEIMRSGSSITQEEVEVVPV